MPKWEEGNFKFPAMPNFEFKNMPDFKSLPDFKDFPKGDPQVFAFPNGKGESFVWRAGQGRTIGVITMPLSKQLAAHFGVSGGSLVNEVRENSPAAKAGITAGDIIVEIDGKSVDSQIDLVKAINGKKEGPISVTVVRDGKRQSFSLTPEVSKDSGFVFDSKDDGE
jgi:membrane-associated protease RseP (regulator of RpoE activity)